MPNSISFANFDYNKCAGLRYNTPFETVLTSNVDDDRCGMNKKSQMHNCIADAVEKVAQSVVNIEGCVNTQSCEDGTWHKASPVTKHVSASGFVVTADGIVITNAHVVSDVASIDVKFANGDTYKGYVIDADYETDLAAIKIKSDPEVEFPAVKLGDYSDVRVGELVAALGSPLRLCNTVTSGIVSAVQRKGDDILKSLAPSSEELANVNKDTVYIQTDAPINVGNSGGPLINLDGEVIGINCLTIQPASGISFAVPSDVICEFVDEAIKVEKSFSGGGEATLKYPKHERFFIGISMLNLTLSMLPSRTAHKLEKKCRELYEAIEEGCVMVARVNANSPADRCGLYGRDIIISVNERQTKSTSELFTEVQKGEPMVLEVYRGPKLLTLHVQPELISRL